MRNPDQQRIASELMQSPELLQQASSQAHNRKTRTISQIPDLSKIPGLRDLKPQAIPWLVNTLIPEQSLVLFSGTFGQYKSWLALDIAYAVVSGGLFANLATEGPRPVLYIDKENGRDRIATRLASMGLTGAPALEDLRYWGNWVSLKFPGVDHQIMLDWAREERGLIVFDSLKRFHRADENNSSQMSVVMEKFISLRDAGASILLLHHAGRAAESRFRGSEEIAAACDVCYHIAKDSAKKQEVRLDQYKNRVTQERTFDLELGQSGRFSLGDGK